MRSIRIDKYLKNCVPGPTKSNKNRESRVYRAQTSRSVVNSRINS